MKNKNKTNKKRFQKKRKKDTNIIPDSNKEISSKLTILLNTVCEKVKAFSVLVQNNRDSTK